jgi:hypothetical protein
MRTATIRTEHADPGTVVAAVSPDNTPEMETRVEGDAVITTIERGSTSGLRSTVDDYVVNVGVADAVAAQAREFDAAVTRSGTAHENSETTNTNTRTNTNTQ